MLLIAAVPLLVLAMVIALQNYRTVAGRALERAVAMRAAAVARHDAVLEGMNGLLGALSGVAALQDAPVGDCAAILRQAFALQHRRVSNLIVVAADGRLRCSARPLTPAEQAWALRLPSAPDGLVALPTVLPAPAAPQAERTTGQPESPAGRPELLLAPAVATGQVSVVATLWLDWLAEDRAVPADLVSAWLLGGSGEPIALANSPTLALPRPSDLAALLEDPDDAIAGTSRGGGSYAYALATLSGDVRLLVATSATHDIAVARSVLVRQLVGLCILLVVGLAAVAVGANQSVVAPIKRLSLAVGRWRGGGAFDPGPMPGLPREIRELSASFAQATGALADREQQLRSSVVQQELLMQEIHHRVKNNLQIVASLLNLQASRIRLPEAKREFQSARDRIRALATLHRHLYAHGDLHTINMRSFLHELCGQLLQALGESGGPDGASPRITLQIEASALQISSDQAVPMALIVTEAVSNAAKYAFPDGRSGRILVRLSIEGDRARLVIEDDGVGIPPGPAETADGVRDGIGLHLIRGFARQLGGELTLTQEHGTRYEVEMPIRRERRDAPETASLG